jgi:hypothetical protein
VLAYGAIEQRGRRASKGPLLDPWVCITSPPSNQEMSLAAEASILLLLAARQGGAAGSTAYAAGDKRGRDTRGTWARGLGRRTRRPFFPFRPEGTIERVTGSTVQSPLRDAKRGGGNWPPSSLGEAGVLRASRALSNLAALGGP